MENIEKNVFEMIYIYIYIYIITGKNAWNYYVLLFYGIIMNQYIISIRLMKDIEINMFGMIEYSWVYNLIYLLCEKILMLKK